MLARLELKGSQQDSAPRGNFPTFPSPWPFGYFSDIALRADHIITAPEG